MAETPYSPRLRTAVVLCGAGTAGAYQAGVLRALAEAGVKVDLFAAQGAGVITAVFGAIDGGARLWDRGGPWTAPGLSRAYRWRGALRLGAAALLTAGALLLSPLLVVIVATLAYAVSLLAGLADFPNISAWLLDLYRRSVEFLFQPAVIPTIVPRAALLAVLAALATLVGSAVRARRLDPSRRRWRGAFWWQLVGSPLDPAEPEKTLIDAVWELVRGASEEPRRAPGETGRRFVEILTENLGQPGFREFLIAVHDLDARRDVIGVVLPPEMNAMFAGRRRGPGPREAEVIDLSGVQRELVVDLLKGALRVPVASPPHLIEFPADSYWRGERHRLCDRPELAARLIDEIAIAGVEQVILVSPAPPAAIPHGLRATPVDLRGRMGEVLRSIETSALQDAWTAAATRFSGVFVIRPDHNPIGPFDFSGAYDETSDRQRTLHELVQQGYDDSYRQFIEPVVATGERVAEI